LIKLDTVTTPTIAHKHLRVSYIIYVVQLLHVSATLLAIFKGVNFKGWVYQDITKVYEPVHLI